MARKKIPLIDETATLNVTGAVSLAGSGSAVITFPSVTSTLATTADLALKANLVSPVFTGLPTAPTPAANDNSTKIATTAYVDTGTSTLSNKRITTRVYSTTTTATLTPDKSLYDILTLTAQSGALTIANPSVTHNDGDQTRIRIYCPTTIGAITFGTNFVAKGGNSFPTTTILLKNIELGFEWNSNLGAYNLLALAVEA